MEHQKTFYLKDGKTLDSVKALAKELKTMSDDVYTHHVNPAKNDFANWIRDSLQNDKLAKNIDGHIKKIDLELEVLRFLLSDPAMKKEAVKRVKEMKAEATKALAKKNAPKKVAKKKSVKKQK